MSAQRPILIGRSTSLVGREAIWQLPDGLEIQSKENYEVVRRRVLFEDIAFVTFHRRYGAAYIVTTGLIALCFLGISFAIVAGAGFDAWPAAIPFAVLGLPAFIACALRVMFRQDIITVFGRRTKASIRFGIRKKRARDAYAQIVAAVRAAQERQRREWNADVAPVHEEPVEIPLPPSE